MAPVSAADKGHDNNAQLPVPLHPLNEKLVVNDPVQRLSGPQKFAEKVAQFVREELPKKRGRFAGIPLSSLVTVELAAVSATLTRSFRNHGLDGVAVDHKANQHRAKSVVLNLDMATTEGQSAILLMVESPLVIAVSMAPPCGTASRARERPVPHHLRARGAPQPPPLRTNAEPYGLSTLSGLNLIRVVQANKIYEFCAKIAAVCTQRRIKWFIENPTNSLMWRLECMAVMCDGSHTHKEWTVRLEGKIWQFDSQKEAEYTKLFCDRIARILVADVISEGAVDNPQTFALALKNPTLLNQGLRAFAGGQARGRKTPQVIPEYSTKQTLTLRSSQLKSAPLDRSKLTKPWMGLPAGSALLHHIVAKEGGIDEGDAKHNGNEANDLLDTSMWGIP